MEGWVGQRNDVEDHHEVEEHRPMEESLHRTKEPITLNIHLRDDQYENLPNA